MISDHNYYTESIRAANNTYQLSITGIHNYKLKFPLQMHFCRQPHKTLGTCSPGDGQSKFEIQAMFPMKQHTQEKTVWRMSIIGTLRYLVGSPFSHDTCPVT